MSSAILISSLPTKTPPVTCLLTKIRLRNILTMLPSIHKFSRIFSLLAAPSKQKRMRKIRKRRTNKLGMKRKKNLKNK